MVALGIVFLVRPFAAWTSMLGSGYPVSERGLISFFGIRGIGSFYYIAYGINHGAFGTSERLWGMTAMVVLVSILVHGITATPAMRWLDRKAR